MAAVSQSAQRREFVQLLLLLLLLSAS